MASRRGTSKRRQRNKRGQRKNQGRGRLPIAIVVGVAAVALAAIGATTFFVVGGSEDQEHHDAAETLDISPENAEIGIAVGDKIPDFDFRLNNGKVVSAANLVDRGKPTFYFFFATW